MELIIIAAMAANRVIGCHHTIPWHIAEDMAHFKATTMGHPVIMGRTTYTSIGGPLSGRDNIVVSRDPHFRPHPDCTVVACLDAAIDRCQTAPKAFVIGGEQLYRAALPLAQTLILTRIGRDYEGDAFFPDFADQPFVLVERWPLAASVPLTIEIYRRMGTPHVPAASLWG
jgi:dihydrofolate reductase